jgi:hypothetical protein
LYCVCFVCFAIPFCHAVSLFTYPFATANAVRELALPVLDYFSSLFRREDGHIAATADHVSSLKKHEQSIAQRWIAVDGTTTRSNFDLNVCNAPDRSISHIEASRGSHERFCGSRTAIIRRDRRDGCHGCLIDFREEAQALVRCCNLIPMKESPHHWYYFGDLIPFDIARSDGIHRRLF